MASDADYRALLEQRKGQSSLQVLFRVARLLNERALQRVRARPGAKGLTAAHLALLPHIDLDGTRAVELARRVGISKQAVGQLIDDLEQLGVCERLVDPNDKRAKLVCFTKRGKRQLLEGLELLQELERECEQWLGQERWREFRATLLCLLRVVETQSQP